MPPSAEMESPMKGLMFLLGKTARLGDTERIKSDSKKQKYNDIINYYRCELSFLIRKLILLCIRGSRNTSNKTNELSNMDD